MTSAINKIILKNDKSFKFKIPQNSFMELNGLKQFESELLHSLIKNKIDVALISKKNYTPITKYIFSGYKSLRVNHFNRTSLASSTIIKSSIIYNTNYSLITYPIIS